MTSFLRRGNVYRPANDAALDLHKVLPPNNFIVTADPMTGELMFEQIDRFPRASKVYGDMERKANRIINTYMSRDVSTGVMLTGEKGSGKTLLSKIIVNKGVDLGFPTIVVNKPFAGDQFNTLIQSIEQPAIVLFDEFEKVYDSEQQEHILTLLDGVFPSKKLFILTCNDMYRVDRHMVNRPGRIYYMLEFSGLSVEFVREYCADVLIDQSQVDSVVKVSVMFDKFNFDMLKAIVEEMNRYGESAVDALQMLNARPTNSGGKYDVSLVHNRQVINQSALNDPVWNGSPVGHEMIVIYYSAQVTGVRNECVASTSRPTPEVVDDDDDAYGRVEFTLRDLRSVDSATGMITYVNSAGDVVTFTRREEHTFSMPALF